VILTHNRSEVVDPELNIDLRKKLEDYHGSLRSTFCYVVPRQPAKILEAINFFTARGFEITDMTPEQVIERDPNAPKTVSRPRRKGLPTLSSFVNDEGKFEASFGYYHNPKAVLTETPQFATMINPNRINLDHFGGSSAMVIGPILRLWGDLGVACPSRASYDKMLELGVKPIEEWVMAQLETELANNTAIATYYQAYAPADFNFGERVMELFAVVRNDETLRKRFKMPAHLPQRERDLVTLLEMWSSDDYTLSRKHPAIYAIKQSWKASPASLKLYDTVHKNPLLKAINLTQLIGMTRNAAPELALKARKLLLSVLKG
jgi:hypothetical protein